MAAASTMASAEPLYRLRLLEELSDHNLSVLGQEVLKADADRWHYAESQHFIGYACSNMDMDTLMRQAEFAYREIGQILKFEETMPKMHIFLLENTKIWNASMKKVGIRPDGLACQVERELYLKYDYDQNQRPDRVPHEVVHARMREVHGKAIPLWFDEGLASYYGWRVAVQYARRSGTALTRTLPSCSDSKVLRLDRLAAVREYPDEGESARTFYRQSEELVSAICEKIGDDRMPDLARALCAERQEMRSVLKSRFGFSDENLQVLERTVKERTTTERTE
jgi:hypothetical protein